MKLFRGGTVVKAQRPVYHSTLGSRVIKEKRRPGEGLVAAPESVHCLNLPRRFIRRGLVCKAHRFVYHSTLGPRVMQKKKKKEKRDLRRVFSLPQKEYTA